MTDKSEQKEIRLKRIRGARAFITVNNIPAIRDNAGVYLVVHAARDIVADLINQHIGLEKEVESQRIRAEAAEELADQANRQAQQAIQRLYAEKEAMSKEKVEMLRERNMRVNELHGRAEAAEQERDKLKHILRFILAGPVTTKDEMRYVIDTACEEFVKLYPEELEGSQPDGE